LRGLRVTAAMADIRAGLLLATADIAALPRTMVDRVEFPATAGRVGRLVMVVAADRVGAAGTTQRQVVVDTPVEVDTPVAADTQAVVVAAIPAVEDMAEAIAKKLGDATSLREAAT
jgi:hypothetical protein